jgi:Ulp1 family protease
VSVRRKIHISCLTIHSSCRIITFDSLGSSHKAVGKALKGYLQEEARDKHVVPDDQPLSVEETTDKHVNVSLPAV